MIVLFRTFVLPLSIVTTTLIEGVTKLKPMSATASTTPQYGATTNPGPTSARKTDFGSLPLDYKFRGDAEDSDKWWSNKP